MVLDTIYLCMCQNKEDAPEEIQLQNLGMANNGNTNQTQQNAELEPMK